MRSRLLRSIFRIPLLLYHAGFGPLLGNRFLLLVHRGRRSGRRHETVLEVVRYDSAREESVVVSGFGCGADWYRNILAAAPLEVLVARRRYRPVVRHLTTDEAEATVVDYERRNRAIAPIIRAVLSRLLGWRYDSSPGARRRLVEQLPFVALRPIR